MTDLERVARKLVDDILADLKDRRGIRHAFYDIDEDIQEEIAETLTGFVRAALAATPAGAWRPLPGQAQALERIRHYVDMRLKQPTPSISDSVHSIHLGTEWGAELRLSIWWCCLLLCRRSNRRRSHPMPDLILRPSGNAEKPWSLQLRYHESLGEVKYYTIARVSREVADEIIRAGAPFWLFGEPK